MYKENIKKEVIVFAITMCLTFQCLTTIAYATQTGNSRESALSVNNNVESYITETNGTTCEENIIGQDYQGDVGTVTFVGYVGDSLKEYSYMHIGIWDNNTNNGYSLKAYHTNNYIASISLPVGSYTMTDAGVLNDIHSENHSAPVDFEIKKDRNTRIEFTVGNTIALDKQDEITGAENDEETTKTQKKKIGLFAIISISIFLVMVISATSFYMISKKKENEQ